MGAPLAYCVGQHRLLAVKATQDVSVIGHFRRAGTARWQHGHMQIQGRKRWRILLDEPEILQVALYIRDIAGLKTESHPDLPPLDPSVRVWPTWVRRPSVSAPAQPRQVDLVNAADEWSRWWTHLLFKEDAAKRELTPPNFASFAGVPDLRSLLRQHYQDAVVWTRALHDDPRYKQNMAGPWGALTGLVQELEAERGAQARAFELTITVVPVATRHAWTLGPNHLLISRQLLVDLDNLLDWMRPRLRSMI